MPKTKLLSVLSNLAIFANLVVGFLRIHWMIIIVFIVIHAILRLSYLKAQNELVISQNTTQTTIAPPVIRNIASIITAVILAIIIYGLGFGVAYMMK